MRRPSRGSPRGLQCPISHKVSAAGPVWASGIEPRRKSVLRGQSAVRTARRFCAGSRLGPFDTAQLFSTPSSSRRKS